jgi:hypothetical protein
MSDKPIAMPLSDERRQEIFFALVTAQDQSMDVAQSRQYVAHRYGVKEDEVRQIEREGIDKNWPPLE